MQNRVKFVAKAMFNHCCRSKWTESCPKPTPQIHLQSKGLVDFVRTHGVKVLVGTPVTCETCRQLGIPRFCRTGFFGVGADLRFQCSSSPARIATLLLFTAQENSRVWRASLCALETARTKHVAASSEVANNASEILFAMQQPALHPKLPQPVSCYEVLADDEKTWSWTKESGAGIEGSRKVLHPSPLPSKAKGSRPRRPFMIPVRPPPPPPMVLPPPPWCGAVVGCFPPPVVVGCFPPPCGVVWFGCGLWWFPPFPPCGVVWVGWFPLHVWICLGCLVNPCS